MRALLLTLAASLALSCGAPPEPPARTSRSAPAEPVTARRPVVLFLGDSLSAGFGLPASEAYPARVGQRLAAEGRPIRVVNAGVSGDTSAGGLRRLDWVLGGSDPDVVVLELGGNDGLRGLPPAETEANLRAIIQRCRERGARVLLAGMRLPANYGREHTADFSAIYPRLARELDVPLIPFLLDGVALDPALNLPDELHPNAEGQAIVAATVLAHLRPLLDPP